MVGNRIDRTEVQRRACSLANFIKFWVPFFFFSKKSCPKEFKMNNHQSYVKELARSFTTVYGRKWMEMGFSKCNYMISGHSVVFHPLFKRTALKGTKERFTWHVSSSRHSSSLGLLKRWCRLFPWELLRMILRHTTTIYNFYNHVWFQGSRTITLIQGWTWAVLCGMRSHLVFLIVVDLPSTIRMVTCAVVGVVLSLLPAPRPKFLCTATVWGHDLNPSGTGNWPKVPVFYHKTS